jgi:F0F1-type ATP synthase assembly protein I
MDRRRRPHPPRRGGADPSGPGGAAAQPIGEDDREQALADARRCGQLAAEALQLAQRDIDSSPERRRLGRAAAGEAAARGGGGDMVGGILGGLVIGSILDGIFD